jgi:hypothetical protein
LASLLSEHTPSIAAIFAKGGLTVGGALLKGKFGWSFRGILAVEADYGIESRLRARYARLALSRTVDDASK